MMVNKLPALFCKHITRWRHPFDGQCYFRLTANHYHIIPMIPTHNELDNSRLITNSHSRSVCLFCLSLQYDEQHPHEEFENDVFSDDLSDFDEDLEDEEYDEVYDLDADLDLQHPDNDDETEDGVPEVGSGLLNTDDYDIIRER